ncbi:MAG: radical SAM protein, partial [Syntrophales bacterium]
MLLIYPPVAKPSEPPAGIAKLAGALARHGVACRLLDANMEGALYMLQRAATASDTWSRRAIRHRDDNLAALKNREIYRSPERYARAVRDLQRALA